MHWLVEYIVCLLSSEILLGYSFVHLVESHHPSEVREIVLFLEVRIIVLVSIVFLVIVLLSVTLTIEAVLLLCDSLRTEIQIVVVYG